MAEEGKKLKFVLTDRSFSLSLLFEHDGKEREESDKLVSEKGSQVIGKTF